MIVSNRSDYATQVTECLRTQQYEQALDIYSVWYDAETEWFLAGDPRQGSLAVHLRNAASLARKALYDRVKGSSHVSQRFAKAVDMFFGIQPKHFQNDLQQPSFFYIPDLPAMPFYPIETIAGLEALVVELQRFEADLLQLAQQSYQQYVDTSGPVPNSTDWQQVKQLWLSTHLLRGGEAFEFCSTAIAQVQQLLLTHALVADCRPHAAEAFVSSLLAGAKIPEHFGISNLKLTVHIPLRINPQSSLTVGKQVFTWEPSIQAVVFDDSFLHSAANLGDDRRDVFIFDIWHPSLTENERQAIRHFMDQHRLWSENYAKLAGLDARL